MLDVWGGGVDAPPPKSSTSAGARNLCRRPDSGSNFEHLVCASSLLPRALFRGRRGARNEVDGPRRGRPSSSFPHQKVK
eukprot:9113787-Pyramimonas_sp.AAC.1